MECKMHCLSCGNVEVIELHDATEHGCSECGSKKTEIFSRSTEIPKVEED